MQLIYYFIIINMISNTNNKSDQSEIFAQVYEVFLYNNNTPLISEEMVFVES